MSGFFYPEGLVNTQRLAEHLDDPSVRLVEVVWGNPAEMPVEP